jgi:hypothetical protein
MECKKTRSQKRICASCLYSKQLRVFYKKGDGFDKVCMLCRKREQRERTKTKRDFRTEHGLSIAEVGIAANSEGPLHWFDQYDVVNRVNLNVDRA